MTKRDTNFRYCSVNQTPQIKMYFLPLLLACQDSLLNQNGAQFQSTSLKSKDIGTEDPDYEYQNRGITLSMYEREVLNLINEYRELEDLSAFRLHDALVEIAREHSMDMALGILPLGHDGFDARTEDALDYFEHSAYQIAENVGMARGEQASLIAVETWLESSGHRENIEGPYTYSGIGSYEHNNIIYFTQIFLSVD